MSVVAAAEQVVENCQAATELTIRFGFVKRRNHRLVASWVPDPRGEQPLICIWLPDH